MSEATEQKRFTPPCRYLRTNKMFHGTPEEFMEESDAGYWCEKTRETFGPDGEFAGNRDCHPDRSCYLCY